MTLTAPSLPDDTFAVEKPSRAPRWVVFDFVTGIRTVELADGSMHEELFEPEPLVQMVLSTMPSAVPHDAVVTGSVSPAPGSQSTPFSAIGFPPLRPCEWTAPSLCTRGRGRIQQGSLTYPFRGRSPEISPHARRSVEHLLPGGLHV